MLLEDVSLGFLQSHLLDRSFFDAAVKNTRNKNEHRSSLPAAHKDVNKPECSSMRNKRKLLAHAITYNDAMPTCCFPTRCDTKQKSELAKNAKYLMRPCLLPCSQNQLRSTITSPSTQWSVACHPMILATLLRPSKTDAACNYLTT